MILYGDPSTQASLDALVARLQDRLDICRRTPSLDAKRAFLIEAGALEQAVEDGQTTVTMSDKAREIVTHCRALTDAAAEAFLSACRAEHGQVAEEGLQAVADALGRLPRLNITLTIKLPEGFAFYALYPEAYVKATRLWLARNPDRCRVAVVGIRSIGTTLSAVVAATLRAEGIDAYRVTVRPDGHPFNRTANLPPLKADNALVVDEGPGLSGSSMAAVGEAALRAGIARDRIAFLPGHAGDPGPEASEVVREWWATTPRLVVPTESLCWHGRSLEETFAHALGEVASVEELTGGRWRALAYADEAEWPPIYAPFERRKILVRAIDGSAILWKFVGLTEPGTTLGFMPVPWIEGRVPNSSDASPDVISEIARSLANAAAPPLTDDEAQAAQDRLAQMLICNAKEAGLLPLFTPEETQKQGPSVADDRFAPHDFRRLPVGTIVKVPRLAGLLDHTVVGRQPLAWAVAAALIEWNIGQDTLLEALHANGVQVDHMDFYRAAYAAFRLGMTLHCASNADSHERKRLDRAEHRYRLALTSHLASLELNGF